MDYCRQCILEKPGTNGGIVTQQSWLPEQFAKLGKYLRLLENDIWENGWKVVMVGTRKTRQEVDFNSRDGNRMLKKDSKQK